MSLTPESAMTSVKWNGRFVGRWTPFKYRRRLGREGQEVPDWRHAEDAIAELFRSRGFQVWQQVQVGSGLVDILAQWRRDHEKHHFLVECKNRSHFSWSDEKNLVSQLHRYLVGYTKIRLPKEPFGRQHIIILLGICTRTYYWAHRQIPFKWNPKQLGSEPGRRLYAVRCYITTPPNLKKVLSDANIPSGHQNKLRC